ncbi:MAG: hypothetical protein SLRJCFUN_002644 [Candidatus Fervidibacter sp.]
MLPIPVVSDKASIAQDLTVPYRQHGLTRCPTWHVGRSLILRRLFVGKLAHDKGGISVKRAKVVGKCPILTLAFCPPMRHPFARRFRSSLSWRHRTDEVGRR